MIHNFTPEELAERQSRAVKKAEQLAKDIMSYAHGIGEMHRKHGRKTEEEPEKTCGERIDGTIEIGSHEEWALSLEAIGDGRYWEEKV